MFDSTQVMRPEFVANLTEFLGAQFDSLNPRERGHTIGVVANTLTALAFNQGHQADPEGIGATLDVLGEPSVSTIETITSDGAISYLFPSSYRMAEVIREAVALRRQSTE